MKGHVPTPDALVDHMVARLFEGMEPHQGDRMLDPGCGGGAFVAGVLRWCERHKKPVPNVTAVERNPALVGAARRRFRDQPKITIRHADYLKGEPCRGHYRFVAGNPPYVSIASLTAEERARYKSRYKSALGRFDLYMLFWERALQELSPEGRLAFVTPEKYLYVASASALRPLIAARGVEQIELLDESVFPERTTYPAVTVIGRPSKHGVKARLRDGSNHRVHLPKDGAWWPALMQAGNRRRKGGGTRPDDAVPLESLCVRISAGVATGADRVFVRPKTELSPGLMPFAWSTLAGRELSYAEHLLPQSRRVLLSPYDSEGKLLPNKRLGALGEELRRPHNRERLQARSCVKRKPWYAYHDNLPLADILRPKVICKDIARKPRFYADPHGDIVPLHSLYYLVPHSSVDLDALCAWLNSREAACWLYDHCQRAANGFIRLQSTILRTMPAPRDILHQTREAA